MFYNDLPLHQPGWVKRLWDHMFIPGGLWRRPLHDAWGTSPSALTKEHVTQFRLPSPIRILYEDSGQGESSVIWPS